MKRLLIVADYNRTGGTGTYLKRLIAFLSPCFDVRVSVKADTKDPGLSADAAAQNCRVRFDYILLPRLYRFLVRATRRLGCLLFFLFAYDAFRFYLLRKRYRPDLIIISQGGGLNYFAALRLPVPMIMVTHSLLIRATTFAGVAAYFRYLVGLIPRNKLIICVSSHAASLYNKDRYIDRFDIPIRIVPNYGETRSRAPKPPGPALVLTIGHLEGYKQPHIWLETARRVCELFPGLIHFIWAGDGALLSEYQKKTASLPYVDCLGFRANVDSLYASAFAYFQPSFWESQGIAVVEALSAGLPCVVADSGGLPESVENGREGFVCAHDDIDAYVRAFVTLLDKPDIYAELSRNAKLKFERLFTRERWQSKMIGIINYALEE